MGKRFDSCKLDFSKPGALGQNCTPTGAAAVVRDRNGKLRFPIWNCFQLHGDVGARLVS